MFTAKRFQSKAEEISEFESVGTDPRQQKSMLAIYGGFPAGLA